MASVYHLIANANTFHKEIIKANVCLETPAKKQYFAATIIQRAYRGYLVRKMIKFWNEKATIIQKVVRGWLVRWHRVDYLREYFTRMQLRDLNQQAIKIQACWRGYRVRKETKTLVTELVNQKIFIRRQSTAMRDIFKSFTEKPSTHQYAPREKQMLAEECKKWVLFILFKTHHLMRTKCMEGVYSIHGSNKLSQIEKWMKTLPLKPYMTELKELYNQKYTDETKIEHLFSSRKMREFEYFYRTRDRSRDVKEVVEFDKSIQEKSFDLYKRPKEKPYERQMLYGEKYTKMNRELLRSFSRQSVDFDLFVHQSANVKPKIPPYHVDFWDNKCDVHYRQD